MKTTAPAPIHVDFLGPETLGLPGRFGLTCAPGKNGGGRRLEEDLAWLRTEHGTELLVTLVGEDELQALGIGNLIERVWAHGMESVWFPIADYQTPASPDALRPVVDRILAKLSEGSTVVVHCQGGHGRAGLVAGCCLVARGWAPKKAIAAVRQARPRAIESPEQEEFVVAFSGPR